MIDQTFLVAGGDLRQYVLASLLASEGGRVFVTRFDRVAKTDERLVPVRSPGDTGVLPDCVVLPTPASDDGTNVSTPLSDAPLSLDEAVERAAPSALVLGGRLDGGLKARCAALGLEAVDLLEREELAVLNAVPTAEGALEILLRELPVTLSGASVLVTGFGRVAKVLARDLTALGASVTVAARRQSDLAWAKVSGCEALPLDRLPEAAGDFAAVINTVPAPILDRGTLSRLKGESIVLDLASRPGGADGGGQKRTGGKEEERWRNGR